MLDSILGEMFGVKFERRGKHDDHICIKMIWEDDGEWSEQCGSFSTGWLAEVINVLTEAQRVLVRSADAREGGFHFKVNKTGGCFPLTIKKFREILKNSLVKTGNTAEQAYIMLDKISLPQLVEQVAVDLWLRGFSSDETEEIRAIKYQLKRLHTTGSFDFIDE